MSARALAGAFSTSASQLFDGGSVMGCVILIYDIPDDKIRHKVSERCKDYGLDRIQYSAFAGDLDRNRREELMLRLAKTLGKKQGNIRLQPVCTRDLALTKEIDVEPA
jgi:CRISPR-associated protein Cas2